MFGRYKPTDDDKTPKTTRFFINRSLYHGIPLKFKNNYFLWYRLSDEMLSSSVEFYMFKWSISVV